MKKRSGAGSLSEMVAFELDTGEDDGFGNVTSVWVEQFREPARLAPKMGTESVLASRMTGVQPFLLTVRSSERTRGVTPAWRAVNARSGRAYNILTSVNIDERNAYLEMLVSDGTLA